MRPAQGFQLFLTQRPLEGGAREELGRLARVVVVRGLEEEELREVVVARYPGLAPVVGKVLRLFEVVRHPARLQGLGPGELARVVACLRAGRQVTVRDVFRWCDRCHPLTASTSAEHLPTALYQEAMDVFCRFIPSREVRCRVAQELAFTMNISKEDAEYFTTKHKPSLAQSAAGVQVGRVEVPTLPTSSLPPLRSVFSITRHTAVLLETVAAAVTRGEPVLLVGETGVGKTTAVQFLAERSGRRLRVVNLNQQSDSGDLLGGFRPVSLARSLHPVRQRFTEVFCSTFDSVTNAKFLHHLDSCFEGERWRDAVALMKHTLVAGVRKVGEDTAMLKLWEKVKDDLKTAEQVVERTDLATVFGFVEGALTEAVRQGDWILLDEVNMASSETLDCLAGLLEAGGGLVLQEAGETSAVTRHPGFRLLAAMNPATDAGKADLAPGIRNRFTEVVVDEMTSAEDLRPLIQEYLAPLALPAATIAGILAFYTAARTAAAATSLVSGEGRRPTFSLRTLCRALKVAARNPCGGVRRSLLEGFSLAFLTELDRSSHPVILQLIGKHILGVKEAARLLKQPIQQPAGARESVQVEGFWIARGAEEPFTQEGYILTEQVRRNLGDLCRIVPLCDHPVLLQGDTSVGKTSLVTHLARLTGNSCVRVNNHEHTDIQEYLGSYTSDATGRLVFKLGVLGEAMVAGSWIILDELNLAPTDVLEALNRVLDDNRELFIPETGQTIVAAPGFRLFGTQNPAGQYGGRKVLSRAFRNRFLELHFDQLPPAELETILEKRCALPRSYATKMVKVLGELQVSRKGSAAFAGREGFITLRDLFRWAERYRLATTVTGYHDWDQHLAEEGYLVVAARVRDPEEETLIRTIIAKVFKRTVEPENLFSLSESTSALTKPLLERLVSAETAARFPQLAWTLDLRRLAVLLAHAWAFQEPVLLVGETGCGKTTVVQVLAALQGLGLHTLNCHGGTEAADFLGGLRPDRRGDRLFCWADGPLVTAMRRGEVFLADEMSLAEDSVLERMNSVLEPERRILLAERVTTEGQDVDVVEALPSFRFVATMNPGGDYGKKELSPALRNRFSEVWCPAVGREEDLRAIVARSLSPGLAHLAPPMVAFARWLKGEGGAGVTVSVRDLLAWVTFVTTVVGGGLATEQAVVEGAHLVWLDGLAMEGVAEVRDVQGLATRCRARLAEVLGVQVTEVAHNTYLETEDRVTVSPFSFPRTMARMVSSPSYSFTSPTTSTNVGKILRGLQIAKPILLEGSPGIGKTSLVTALAARVGVPVVRINLSDQTDVADLFGADLPVEGGAAGVFEWRSGAFLAAMQQGHWVLLDELNLASQSVLEGLNAVFDHRGEVFIPELGRTFPLHPATRVFACQNPTAEGGDRKGLPRSFLNRFSKVHMAGLDRQDLELILGSLHPDLPGELVARMVAFNCRLEEEVVRRRAWGRQGAPWEFNLRDLLRWSSAMARVGGQPGKLVRVIYAARMRREEDRQRVVALYRELFEPEYPLAPEEGGVHLTPDLLHLGHFTLPRGEEVSGGQGHLLAGQRHLLEALACCVANNWPCILTGASQAGKTSLVEVLATLAGRALVTLSLASSTDTIDLLGGFEQTDVGRSLGELVEGLVEWGRVAAVGLMARNLGAALLLLQALLQLERMAREERGLEQVNVLATIVSRVQEAGADPAECRRKLEEVEVLRKEVEEARRKGTFEWVDSVLVEAVREGKWLVIDHANACSASVLDRLNCLLESGGELVLGERGEVGGKVPSVPTHPDFRAFLLYDPSRGEVSRAMRNRGVEVHVSPSLTPADLTTITLASLGPAAASSAAVSRARRLVEAEGGLQGKANLLAVLAQHTLAGGEGERMEEEEEEEELGVEERLLWRMPTAGLVCGEVGRCLLQLRPVLQLGSEEAVLLFLHYTTSSGRPPPLTSPLPPRCGAETWPALSPPLLHHHPLPPLLPAHHPRPPHLQTTLGREAAPSLLPPATLLPLLLQLHGAGAGGGQGARRLP